MKEIAILVEKIYWNLWRMRFLLRIRCIVNKRRISIIKPADGELYSGLERLTVRFTSCKKEYDAAYDEAASFLGRN